MNPSEAAVAGGLRVEAKEGAAIWRVALATPKANILDMEKIEGLTKIFERARADRHVKAVLLEAEGDHFSFGASVPEHLPGNYEKMIPAFGNLFRWMMEAPVVTLAAVRGQCLGGGLELVSMCHRVFASPTTKMGQPEIVLGVLAPVASVVLPERIGRRNAEDLCLTGRVISAEEAHGMGLIDELTEDPSATAMQWAERHLLPRSSSSLRLAVRAARSGWAPAFRERLAEAERLYLEDLMGTQDAVEGLQAFLERRDPNWRNA